MTFMGDEYFLVTFNEYSIDLKETSENMMNLNNRQPFLPKNRDIRTKKKIKIKINGFDYSVWNILPCMSIFSPMVSTIS